MYGALNEPLRICSRPMIPNKLGHYIYRRICKDQEVFRKNKPRNYVGLYIQPKDIQRYIYDYTNYGIDYSGDDNDCAEDRWESMMNEPGKERYWDEADEDL